MQIRTSPSGIERLALICFLKEKVTSIAEKITRRKL